MIAGGLGSIDAGADAEDRVPGRHAADPARRPGHAHRHGRRRGELDGRPAPTRPSSTSTRCSAATPRSSAARRRSSTIAGSRATRTRSWRSTTSAPAACRNAFPELTNDAGRGARFDLRRCRSRRSGLAPKEIWCNESQERYVLAIAPESLPQFRGVLRARALPVRGGRRGDRGAPAAGGRRRRRARSRSTCRWTCCSASRPRCTATCSASPRALHAARPRPASTLQKAAIDVLRHPTVASKRFLVTIGDRTVGGLSHRDQMVGPWQVPVADCAVTLADYQGFAGEAMSMGERTPLAALDAPASGRMAVGEAITNLLAAPIELSRVKLVGQLDGRLRRAGRGRRAVRHRARRSAWSCARRSASRIPVGKDSACRCARSGRTAATQKKVTSPVSLIVTAFATLADVRGTLDAAARCRRATRTLVLVDLGRGRHRMGGSILAQTLAQSGDDGARPRRSAGPGRSWSTRSTRCAPRAGSSRTTTAATAACSPRPARWRSPATSAWRSTSTCWSPKATASPTAAPSTATPRTGPAQVSARREELTLEALFNEELGVLLQVRDRASATR